MKSTLIKAIAVICFIFTLALGAQADTVYQTATASGDLGWMDPADWDNLEAPSSAHDYVCDGKEIRDPLAVYGATFPGKSLVITNGGKLKLNKQNPTITNLTMVADNCTIATVGNRQLSGDLAVTGSGTLRLDVETERHMTIHSEVTAEDSVSSIRIFASQRNPLSPATAGGVTFTDPDNTFSGTWDIEEGYLKGVGFGEGRFEVGPYGYLDFDSAYSNELATLTVEGSATDSLSGGLILLDQNVTFGAVTLFWEDLPAGVYTGAELKSHAIYGAAFDPASSDSATITVVGLMGTTITQTGSHPGGYSWDSTNYWSDGLAPAFSNDYVNSGFATRTPVEAGPTFGGHSLTLTNNGSLIMKHSGTSTVRLTASAGSKISNGGSSGVLAGTLALVGAGTVVFDLQGTGRTIVMNSRMTAPAVDTISVQMNQTPWSSPSNTGGVVMNDAANVFAGTWDVDVGMLKGIGFGTGSFDVGALGFLDFDADYTNEEATLTIATGGQILLDQDLSFLSATINGLALPAGKTFTGAELKAHPVYGSAFDAASSDTTTITTVPSMGIVILVQ